MKLSACTGATQVKPTESPVRSGRSKVEPPVMYALVPGLPPVQTTLSPSDRSMLADSAGLVTLISGLDKAIVDVNQPTSAPPAPL